MFKVINCLNEEIQIPKGNPHLWKMKETDIKVFGEDGKEYFNENIDEEKCLELIREKRNELLAETDWAMLPDISLTDSVRSTYIVYRQELRDLPNKIKSEKDLFKIKFPRLK